MTASRAYHPKAGRNDWRTPAEVVGILKGMWGGISLDPCASPDPAHHFADINFAPPNNGLDGGWYGDVFVNPPFDALAAWAEKCADQAQKTARSVVLLLPARTDTRYWHGPIATAKAICFWRGRLTFVGGASVAPFPVAFVYWGPHPWRFRDAFAPHGMVVTP